MFLAVFCLWLFAATGVVYHFCKTEVVSGFILGFWAIWYFVWTAKEAPWELPTRNCGHDTSSPAECGVIAGIISVIVSAIILLILAVWSLYKLA